MNSFVSFARWGPMEIQTAERLLLVRSDHCPCVTLSCRLPKRFPQGFHFALEGSYVTSSLSYLLCQFTRFLLKSNQLRSLIFYFSLLGRVRYVTFERGRLSGSCTPLEIKTSWKFENLSMKINWLTLLVFVTFHSKEGALNQHHRVIRWTMRLCQSDWVSCPWAS